LSGAIFCIAWDALLLQIALHCTYYAVHVEKCMHAYVQNCKVNLVYIWTHFAITIALHFSHFCGIMNYFLHTLHLYTFGAEHFTLPQNPRTHIATVTVSVSGRHIFANIEIDDTIIGAILLLFSLAILIGCLISIVKLLSSVLRGRVVNIVHKTVNAELPGRFGFLTG
jgi:hypothetical protein